METSDNVWVQYDEKVGPASPHRAESVKNVDVKNVEGIQQPTHEEEQERELDTSSNLSALFCNSSNSSAERRITINVPVPAEATGTFLGEDSTTMNAIRDNMRCIEMNMMEVNIRAYHRIIEMFMPDTDVAHKTESIIMNVVQAHEEGTLYFMKKVRAKGIMTRATEGDAAADLLTYLPTGEVVNTVLVLRS